MALIDRFSDWGHGHIYSVHCSWFTLAVDRTDLGLDLALIIRSEPDPHVGIDSSGDLVLFEVLRLDHTDDQFTLLSTITSGDPDQITKVCFLSTYTLIMMKTTKITMTTTTMKCRARFVEGVSTIFLIKPGGQLKSGD